MNKSFFEYPSFSPNQVLTDKQLNQLRFYNEKQNLLTRTHLIGVGVVIGLECTYIFDHSCGEHHLLISPGYGVTSEGELLALIADEHNQNHSGEDNDTFVYKYYRPFNLSDEAKKKEPYKHWSSYGNCIELLTERQRLEVQEDTVKPLTEQYIGDHAVMLYMDSDTVEEGAAVTGDCDTPMTNVRRVPRIIMVPIGEDLANSPIEAIPSCDKEEDELFFVKRLAEGVERPIGNGSFIGEYSTNFDPKFPLTNLSKPEELNRAYGKIVEGAKSDMLAALKKAFEKYKSHLDLGHIEWTDIRAEVDRVIIQRKRDDSYSQNDWRHLELLSQAFMEFVGAVRKLSMSNQPANDFPDHLMLTAFKSQPGSDEFTQPDGYRHHFRSSPVKNVLNEEWQHARSLFLRIKAMLDTYDPGVDEYVNRSHVPVNITPSYTDMHDLGKLSIPYFYFARKKAHYEALKNYWQPKLCQTVRPLLSYYFWDEHPDRNTSYNPSLEFKVSDYQRDPLAYSISEFDLLQVEGHLGKDLSEAYQQIDWWRKRYNLDFDLVKVFMDGYLLEEKDKLEGFQNSIKTAIIRDLDIDEIFSQKHLRFERNQNSRDKSAWEGLEKVMGNYREWYGLRVNRSLHSCIDHLKGDYLTVRSKFIQFINLRLKEQLQLEENPLLPDSADSPIDTDNVRKLAFAICIWERAKEYEETVAPQSFRTVSGLDPVYDILEGEMGDWNIKLAEMYDVLCKVAELQRLSKELLSKFTLYLLPKELLRFSIDLFNAYYKQWHSLVIYQNLILTKYVFKEANFKRLSDFNLTDLNIRKEEKIQLLNLKRLHEVVYDSIGMMVNPLPVELATIYYTLEFIREKDISSFQNLTEKVLGLEHLGGVPKGGTIFIIGDRECAKKFRDVDALTIADFAIGSKLPCLQPRDYEFINLPPSAMNDYQEIDMPNILDDNENSIDYKKAIYFDVKYNDFEGYYDDLGFSYYIKKEDEALNLDPRKRISNLKVILNQNKSRLGNKVTVIDREDDVRKGWIKYEVIRNKEETQEIAIDYIDYELLHESENHTDQVRDRGRIFLLIRFEQERSKGIVGKEVRGTVSDIFTKEQLNGVDVAISGISDDNSSIIDEALTTEMVFEDVGDAPGKGRYQFFLPPGKYTMNFSKEGYEDNNNNEIELKADQELPFDKSVELIPKSFLRNLNDGAEDAQKTGITGREIAEETPSSSNKTDDDDENGNTQKFVLGKSPISTFMNNGIDPKLFVKREIYYQKQGALLNADQSFKGNYPYQLGMQFLFWESTNLDEISRRYIKVFDTLSRIHKDFIEEKRSNYRRLLQLVTYRFWDALVQFSYFELGHLHQEALIQSIEKVRTVHLNSMNLLREWNGDVLAQLTLSPIISQIIELVSEKHLEMCLYRP